MCDAADAARRVLNTYDIAFPEPLDIVTVPGFSVNCVGVYHCGENRIELLSLNALAKARSEKSIFQPLTTPDYFASIILHEMVHAAYDGVDCAHEFCGVTSEYLAYALQLDALAPDMRAHVTQATDPDAPVGTDELNVVILMMTPDKFALKAWRHFSQQVDMTAFVADIMDGRIVLDRLVP